MDQPAISGQHPTAPSAPVSNGDRAVAEVCASATFQKTPVLRELLLYLWRNRDAGVNEYAIGVDVLGRKPAFNPKNDATVRVHVSRLRQKLREYYETDGKQANTRLHVPMGAHRLALIEAVIPVAVAASVAGPVGSHRKPWSQGRLLRTVAILALILLCFALAVDDWHLRRGQPTRSSPEAIHPFWRPILKSRKSVNVIVPAPVFLFWPNLLFVARDFRVSSLEAAGQSPILQMLQRQFGKPELSQLYTVASDTAATSTLARYLQARDVGASIFDTPAVTVDLLESTNSIVLTGAASATQLDEAIQKTNFYLKVGVGGVFNHHPLPGEPEQWQSVQISPARSTIYGIIARLAGKTPATKILMLESAHNQNLASVLTSAAELDKIESFRVTNGSPDYFEVVIRLEVSGDKTLKSAPIAFRAIPASPR